MNKTAMKKIKSAAEYIFQKYEIETSAKTLKRIYKSLPWNKKTEADLINKFLENKKE